MFALVFWRYTSVEDRVRKMERKHIHPEAQRPGEEKHQKVSGPCRVNTHTTAAPGIKSWGRQR